MPVTCGLVGLPNAGKSTLFNCITAGGAATAPYAFTTVEPNRGAAAVPDQRLERLARIVRTRSSVPAYLEVVDIAGLVKGASRGEGLGNRFLGHIREVDVIAHVVRCHTDGSVPHTDPSVDPARDAGIVNLELILADLETVQRRRERIAKAARYGEKREAEQDRVFGLLEDALKQGIPARRVELDQEGLAIAGEAFLITMKPVVYVGNIQEGLAQADSDPLFRSLLEVAAADRAPVTAISAKIEAEISELGEEERQAFLAEMGMSSPGSHRVIRAAYEALDYVTFYTFNEKEARAWPVNRGTHAPQAAGRVHTDMEKGFVKAEVLQMRDLETTGSFGAAREKGLLRIEGRDYEIQDGDVVFFRFTS